MQHRAGGSRVDSGLVWQVEMCVRSAADASTARGPELPLLIETAWTACEYHDEHTMGSDDWSCQGWTAARSPHGLHKGIARRGFQIVARTFIRTGEKMYGHLPVPAQR